MSVWSNYEEKLEWIADFRFSLNDALGMLREAMNSIDRDNIENAYHLFESALSILQKLRGNLVVLLNKNKIVKKPEKKKQKQKQPQPQQPQQEQTPTQQQKQQPNKQEKNQ